MGSAFSVRGGYADTYSYWSNQEKEENELAVKLQKKAEDYVVQFVYYGVPVKITKKTVNPTSPLWFEIEEEILEKYLATDNGTLNAVPSYCTVDSKGQIKVYFGLTFVEYMFTVADIDAAKQFAKIDAALGVCPAPNPPNLVKAESNALHIQWSLPQPPGIAQFVDIQYAIFNSAKHSLEDFSSEKTKSETKSISNEFNTNSLQWNALVSKNWSNPTFDSYVLESLRVGIQIVFRLRYKMFYGWSFYSPASAVMETLPGPPCAPIAPIIGGVFTDSVQLFWFPPSITNGRPVTDYILRGRAVGDEFVELYHGPQTCYLVTNLFPQACYTFDLAALNEIGPSKYSNGVTVLTLPARTTSNDLSHSGFVNPAALQLRDAWIERWDPKTEKYFYFNRVTGTRQLHKPDCWLSDTTSSKKLSPEELAKEDEVKFRTKRFRVTMMIHKRSKQGGHAPAGSPSSDHRRMLPDPSLTASNTGPSPIDNQSLSVSVAAPVLTSPLRSGTRGAGDIYSVELHRSNLLADAMKFIGHCPISNLHRRLKVTFAGEEGIDSGGLGKEAFLLISKQAASWAISPENKWMQLCQGSTGRGLFFAELPTAKPASAATTTNIKQVTNQQNDSKVPSSSTAFPFTSSTCLVQNGLDDPHQFATFLGRLFGKALFDRQLIDFPLSQLLLRHMIGNNSNGTSPRKIPQAATNPGQGPTNTKPAPETSDTIAADEEFQELLIDVQQLDKTLHQSITWMLKNSVKDVIYETFSVVTPFGQMIPLCANGDKKEVTDDNKFDYVKLLVQWVTNYSVIDSLTPFLTGFHELVSKEILLEAGITPVELDLMLNGKVYIDVEELRPYVIYQPANQMSQFGEGHWLVVWLWQVVVEFSSDQRSCWLQFFTGCSKMPLDGFDPPINITEGSDMQEDSLPKAHTCFNQLVIPPYSSFEKMKEKFLFAIANTSGFELS